MLALLSPSKTLDFEPYKAVGEKSVPALFKDSEILLKSLKKLSKKQIAKMMDISEKLAELNYKRFQDFSDKFTDKNSKQAIFAFTGDVYTGLDAGSLSTAEIKRAQKKIAILSGLYGLIRPHDVIQPYRLEMGIKLKNERGADLYKFWDDKITDEINKIETTLIINLASKEYFKSVNAEKLKGKLIKVNFLEKKAGKYKVIALFAKKARGSMARFIVKENVSTLAALKEFNYEGYKFAKQLSNESELTFIRG